MTTMEKATTNPRRSQVDLSAEHLRVIVAGDVAAAHECEGRRAALVALPLRAARTALRA